jgi:hypothetical protein
MAPSESARAPSLVCQLDVIQLDLKHLFSVNERRPKNSHIKIHKTKVEGE